MTSSARILPRATVGLLNTYQGIYNRATMPRRYGIQRGRGISIKRKFRGGGGYTMNKRRRRGKQGTTGRGVTFEHDRQFIYRKKRMPYRQKRRWVSFKRKVNAVAEKDMGTRMVLFNTGQSFTNSTATFQGVVGLTLYGRQSNGSTWYDDLRYLSDLENDGNPTAANGDRVGTNAKMIFQSAVLDLTIRNISAKDGVLDPECTLETDIYECTMSKAAELGAIPYDDISSLFIGGQTAAIYDQNVPGLGFRISLEQRGCTPFEMNKAVSQFGFKVWKKTKFFLKSGQNLTYQVRDPKRHVVYRNKMTQSSAGFNKPGMTKIVLVIYKSVPGITVGPAAGQTQEIVTCGVTRKYMYKIEGLSEDRSIRVVR